jgi:hypothetical protein
MYLKLIIVLFVIIVIFVIAAIVISKKSMQPKDWLTIIFSMMALVGSVLSFFKSDLLPSRIMAIGGNVLLAQTSPPSRQQQPEIPIVFCLSFINEGYGDDIIEWVGVTALNKKDNTTIELRPKDEIDFQKFFNRGYLHPDNFISPFSSFSLPAKSSLTKTIVFYQNPYEGRYIRPSYKWEEGNYSFDIYIKTVRSTYKQLVINRSTHYLDQRTLDKFFAGESVYLDNSNFDF